MRRHAHAHALLVAHARCSRAFWALTHSHSSARTLGPHPIIVIAEPPAWGHLIGVWPDGVDEEEEVFWQWMKELDAGTAVYEKACDTRMFRRPVDFFRLRQFVRTFLPPSQRDQVCSATAYHLLIAVCQKFVCVCVRACACAHARERV